MRRISAVIALAIMCHTWTWAEEKSPNGVSFKSVQEEAEMGKMWPGTITRWEFGYMMPDNFKFEAHQTRLALIIKGFVLQGDILKAKHEAYRYRIGIGYSHRLELSKHWALDLRATVGYTYFNRSYAIHYGYKKRIQKELHAFEKEYLASMEDAKNEVENNPLLTDAQKTQMSKDIEDNYEKQKASVTAAECKALEATYGKKKSYGFIEFEPQLNYVFNDGNSLFVGYSVITHNWSMKKTDPYGERYLHVGWKLHF